MTSGGNSGNARPNSLGPAAPDLARFKVDGHEYRRSLRLRVALSVAVAVSLIIAAGAFAYALAQSQHVSADLAAEIRRHCLVDTAQANQRRALDLALIHSDRVYISALERELAGADPRTHRLILATIDRARANLIARTADLPHKRDPANCAVR